MALPDRPLRADAVRNRARVLEVAYETFAAEGLAVPIDEIARRACVDDGRAVLESGDPGEALFTFLRSMVLQWGATDRGLVDAFAGVGIDIKDAVPDAEDAFLALLGELLRAAQTAGTVRRDVDVPDVKALVVGCQAMQAYRPDTAARLTEVVLDGLRTS